MLGGSPSVFLIIRNTYPWNPQFRSLCQFDVTTLILSKERLPIWGVWQRCVGRNYCYGVWSISTTPCRVPSSSLLTRQRTFAQSTIIGPNNLDMPRDPKKTIWIGGGCTEYGEERGQKKKKKANNDLFCGKGISIILVVHYYFNRRTMLIMP